MTFDEMAKRYREDAHFSHLVNGMMFKLINGHVSPYELRDACTYALDKFAIHKPPDPIILSQGEVLLDGSVPNNLR